MSVREAWATAWLITCTAWAVLVVSGDSDVFQCLSPAGENSSVRSCLHGVLCPVGPAGLCDGRSADCPGGRDEARGLCEDPRWSGLPCPLRCDGGRPGQCLGTRALRCDGVYHCADRSDESGCAGLGGDRDLFGKTDYEEVAESAGLWALVFLVVGVPLTWLAKHLSVKWFVSAFGRPRDPATREARRPRWEREEELALSSDEDVLLMLEFICAMVLRVEEAGQAVTERREEDERLWELFRRVHFTGAWNENARVVFDMGHLLFDAKMELVDEFHVAMYELEKRFHGGVNLELNVCLKHDLGNKMVDELRWSTEPPGIRKIQMMLPSSILNTLRMVWFKAVLVYVGLLADTVGYYFDFVKDWVIFAILYKSIDKSTFYRFEVQLVLLLFIFLIFPEIIRGSYFANKFKRVLGVTDYSFDKIPEYCLKVAIVVLSPFIPAVLLWERGKIAYESLQVQRVLYCRLETCMDNPRTKMDQKMIEAFKEDFREYHESLLDGDRLLRINTDTKYLEASTETLFQYMLQLLVVLVVTSDSAMVEVTPGLESVFFDKGVGVLLYLSLTLSFISLTNTRVKLEKHKKFGLFKTTAKLQFGFHSALTLVTKIFCVVFYFAPSLGLFGLSAHYRGGRVPFDRPDSLIVDVVSGGGGVTELARLTTVSEVWPDPIENYEEHYTIAGLATLYLFFLFFVPFLCAGLYILKWNLIPSFYGSRSLSSRVLHVISCLAFPSVFRDWDDKRTEDAGDYARRWPIVRFERALMTLWHLAANLAMVVPLIYTCARIIGRHRELSAAGFSATEEEHSAFVTACCLVSFVPLSLAALALAEWELMELYYRSGHPWSRILVDLTSDAADNPREETPEVGGAKERERNVA